MYEPITLREAKALVNDYGRDYLYICNEIRKAASCGKTHITVVDPGTSSLSSRLESAGFCVTHYQHPERDLNPNELYIYWGS